MSYLREKKSINGQNRSVCVFRLKDFTQIATLPWGFNIFNEIFRTFVYYGSSLGHQNLLGAQIKNCIYDFYLGPK